MRQVPIIFILSLSSWVSPYCWVPNNNPFTGPPDTQRLEGSTTVRVTWEKVFPQGPGCDEVEFLIKSHPLNSPSNYKLSDLTLKGKRTAVLAVPPGEDFIFQVIARENKGPGIGIEYAYSRAATSVANPTPSQVQGLRQSIWVAGDTGTYTGNTNVRGQSRPSPTSAPTTKTTTTQRSYLRPNVRSLGLGGGPPYNNRLGNSYNSYGNGYSQQQRQDSLTSNFVQPEDELEIESEAAAGPWYVYECIPLLKNLAGFEDGSKKNSILTQFIQHMNKNAVVSVQNFITSDKSCKSGYEGKERGYLVQTNSGDNKCCSTPWGSSGSGAGQQPVCYDQFARCDGRCIPHDWVSDGWPDCMDGADEATLSVDGKVMTYQLGCVQCAGVVLSASFLCLESQTGLTRQCVEGVMGPGECNACIQEFLSLP